MLRSRRCLSTALGAALAIAALSAPAANAVTSEEFRASTGSTSASESTDSPAPTVTRAVDEGFDLGSAAIGAGSAATILLLSGAGATMIVRRRRVHLAG
jgi:hypothetical protein